MFEFFPDRLQVFREMKAREKLTPKEYGQRLANSKKHKKKRSGRRK